MVLQGRISVTDSKAAMSMQKKNVRNVLQNFIAAADVQQMLITLQETSMRFMRQAVNCKENVWNARS